MPVLTVILCTHSPHRGRLDRTLESLRRQSFPTERWEFLLIDNASPDGLNRQIDLSWQPRGRIIREDRLGLTQARLCGIAHAESSCIVWVDDDNVLDERYLEEAHGIFSDRPRIGVFGGRVLPEFEKPVDSWFEMIHGPLGLADHGDEPQIAVASDLEIRGYPGFAPPGAGMCARREALKGWAARVNSCEVRKSLGRTGVNLSSGEDNDMVLCALEEGWDVGYFPTLTLTHLMPESRLTADYHARLLEASNRTWVVALGLHGLSPWKPIRPWTLGLRKLRAAVRLKPWLGTVAYLRWKSACGQLAGRSQLWELRKVLAQVGKS